MANNAASCNTSSQSMLEIMYTDNLNIHVQFAENLELLIKRVRMLWTV